MVIAPLAKQEKGIFGRNDNSFGNGNGDGNGAPERAGHRGQVSPSRRNGDGVASRGKPEAELKDYQLGDCLGKGAFGSVYRALNWGTGETVAVKQVKLTDLPKSEMKVIMAEIDLLKNLNHPNIVKYHGSQQATDALYIILEYCENGSLHSISKNFGKFPENLVALYMSQVLQGLVYLHDQGVIHRDIKGANILTTKEGLVKLADFGVATRTAGLHESSVVGTPYWMAPEVIELSGATTASDIWSLGCTVIELLEGRPPYYKLQPMPALFRIVNDDHPPLPESASPIVTDFLMQCFQKDPNLRISARKLLRHPWIVSAKRTDAVVPVKPTIYEEAVKTVQHWNEALKSPENSFRREFRAGSTSPVPNKYDHLLISTSTAKGNAAQFAQPGAIASPDDLDNNIWDDDFASSISSSGLQLQPHLKPIDKFGGALSSDKLKAYATTEEGNTMTVHGKSARESSYEMDSVTSDPLSTLRAASPVKSRQPPPSKQVPRGTKPQRTLSQPKTQILRGSSKPSADPRAGKGTAKIAAAKRPPTKRSSSLFREESIGDYSDLIVEDDDAFDQKINQIRKAAPSAPFSPTFPHVSDLKTAPRSTTTSKANSSSLRSKLPSSPEIGDEMSIRRIDQSFEIQKYAEKPEDQDFSDIFNGANETSLGHHGSDSASEQGTMSVLNSKISSNSWLGDEEEEDDPFAQLEENLDEVDLDAKVARDRHMRLCSLVEGLVGSLKTSQSEDYLADLTDQLMQVLYESPDLKSVVVSSHGLLPILEILDGCQRSDISLRLLKIINIIIMDSVETQETLCFVGGIPIVTKFAYKKYSSEIRLEAAAFVRQMYQASMLTLQMFISCGGLNVLVEFLEEDYDAERDLVLIGVNGVWSVFELQGPTPKNDFCRIFSRSTALYPLSLVLNRVLDEEGELAELVEGRIANIFFIFSQAENHVKESVADRMILKKVLKDLKRMSPDHQITMLKFIKNLSMLATTLESLQNSNCIEELADLLESSMKLPDGKQKRETWNHISNIMFNLCRLSKTRQEDAALNGVIPLLQKIADVHKPIKNFALPILCDMAHSGKVCRKILWQNKGLNYYIGLLEDTYWGGTALDAIFIWLQEETAKVEEHLLDGSFSRAIINCFLHAERDAFENVLEPLQKLLRLSPPVAATLSHPQLFSRTTTKLMNKKAVVRVNLLRIIRSICDACEEQGSLIRSYGLHGAISRLAEADPAILVRNMAGDLLGLCELSDRHTADSARYRHGRRTSSATMTPPPLYNSSSLPPTPQRSAVQSTSYFDLDTYQPAHPRSRTSNINGNTPYRPVSREGSSISNGVANKFALDLQARTANANSPFLHTSTPPFPSTTTATATPPSTLASGSKSRLPYRASMAATPPSTSSANASASPGRASRASTTAKTPIRSSRLGRDSAASENMPPPPAPVEARSRQTPTPTFGTRGTQASAAREAGRESREARSSMFVNPRRRRQTAAPGSGGP